MMLKKLCRLFSTRTGYVADIKDHLWRLFSDGGELQWIDDINVLTAVSDAYFFTTQIRELERYYLGVTHYPGKPWNYDPPRGVIILGYLSDMDKKALEAMQIAITAISNKLA